MLKTFSAVALALLTLATPALAIKPTPPQRTTTPVMVGAGPEFDACGGVGRVKRLNPRGDNFLSVRAAPSTKAREIGRLRGGDLVYMCDAAGGGRWAGIVHEGGKVDTGCGVTSPVVPARAYRGPCRSGWVASEFVQVIAG